MCVCVCVCVRVCVRTPLKPSKKSLDVHIVNLILSGIRIFSKNGSLVLLLITWRYFFTELVAYPACHSLTPIVQKSLSSLKCACACSVSDQQMNEHTKTGTVANLMTPWIHLYFLYKWTICASACHGAPKTVQFFFVLIHATKSETSWPLGRVAARCNLRNLKKMIKL